MNEMPADLGFIELIIMHCKLSCAFFFNECIWCYDILSLGICFLQLSVATTTLREHPISWGRRGRSRTRDGWWWTALVWEKEVDASHAPPEVKSHLFFYLANWRQNNVLVDLFLYVICLNQSSIPTIQLPEISFLCIFYPWQLYLYKPRAA